MFTISRILGTFAVLSALACNPASSSTAGASGAADVGALEKKADMYASRGRPSAGEFFRRSASVARGQRWQSNEALPEDFVCDVSTPPLQISASADNIQTMVNEGRYDDAIAAVQEAITHDPSCAWQVQMADLIRLKSMIDPTSVDKQQQEDAIGTLIAAGQSGQLPLGAVGRSSVFFSLGQYFQMNGERSQAIAAYLTARDLLGDDGLPESVTAGMEKAIDQALQRLNA